MRNSEQLAAVRERLAKGNYLPWGYAGGPNECQHGYAAGIPCQRCDELFVSAATTTFAALIDDVADALNDAGVPAFDVIPGSARYRFRSLAARVRVLNDSHVRMKASNEKAMTGWSLAQDRWSETQDLLYAEKASHRLTRRAFELAVANSPFSLSIDYYLDAARKEELAEGVSR